MPRAKQTAPLVIGVTGHRNIGARNRKLAGLVRAECARLRKEHRGRTFVVLSPLAEGADRLVARVAMDVLDARLVVPLPLPLDDADGYRKDFPASALEFERLLTRADKVVPGPLRSRDGKWRAYGAARNRQYAWVGAYIAERADVLFALWDGRPARGVGGTGQIVRWYLAGQVPKAHATRDGARAAAGKAGRRQRTGAGRMLVHVNPETGEVARRAAGQTAATAGGPAGAAGRSARASGPSPGRAPAPIRGARRKYTSARAR